MKKIVMLLLVMVFVCVGGSLVMAAEKQISFSDIQGHWAEATIMEMAGQGIINGYSDGTFRPNEPVTTAEFLKLLLLYLSEDKPSGKRFWKQSFLDDMDLFSFKQVYTTTFDFKPGSGYWAEPFIQEAVKLRFVNQYAYADKWNTGLEREYVAELVNNVALQFEISYSVRYSDLALVSVKDIRNAEGLREKNAVANALVRGLMQGYEDGNFGLGKLVTRAEALTVLERILDKSKRKPITPDISVYVHAYGQDYMGRTVPIIFNNEKQKKAYELILKIAEDNIHTMVHYTAAIMFRNKKDLDAFEQDIMLPLSPITVGLNPEANVYFINLKPENDAISSFEYLIMSYLDLVDDAYATEVFQDMNHYFKLMLDKRFENQSITKIYGKYSVNYAAYKDGTNFSTHITDANPADL